MHKYSTFWLESFMTKGWNLAKRLKKSRWRKANSCFFYTRSVFLSKLCPSSYQLFLIFYLIASFYSVLPSDLKRYLVALR